VSNISFKPKLCSETEKKKTGFYFLRFKIEDDLTTKMTISYSEILAELT
jgi:hypothetical protein